MPGPGLMDAQVFTLAMAQLRVEGGEVAGNLARARESIAAAAMQEPMSSCCRRRWISMDRSLGPRRSGAIPGDIPARCCAPPLGSIGSGSVRDWSRG